MALAAAHPASLKKTYASPLPVPVVPAPAAAPLVAATPTRSSLTTIAATKRSTEQRPRRSSQSLTRRCRDAAPTSAARASEPGVEFRREPGKQPGETIARCGEFAVVGEAFRSGYAGHWAAIGSGECCLIR